MKIKALLSAMILIPGLISCSSDSDNNEPLGPALNIEQALSGEWLLASSDAEEWTTYEFKTSGQMSSEVFSNGGLNSYYGSYFCNNEQASLTGTLNMNNGRYLYLDWIVKSLKTYQIDIEIYGENGNQLIQTTSLYKVLLKHEMEIGKSQRLDYRGITGTNNYSDFKSLDEAIVTVDSATGEIRAVGEGATFVVFNTQGGYAAVAINVITKVLPLSENILGSWVTDNIGYIWERDVFGPDNYFYANWSREVIYPTDNESGQGSYSVDDRNMSITVSAKTPYGQRLNVEYLIQEIDRFSFYTHVYSGGDKTGEFYFQRILDSVTMHVGEKLTPDYVALTGGIAVYGYGVHEDKKATVNSSGEITAVSKGITYIDVNTPQGAGVIEVIVE